VNNEYACASLAVLREDTLPSCSPQTPGTRFECLGGPKGQPERYFLFPPSELTAAGDRPYNIVFSVQEINGEFFVSTNELPGDGNSAAVYRFSHAMEPLDMTFDGDWASRHRRLHQEGRVNHGLRDCPQLMNPKLVRRWDSASGWTAVQVPQSASIKPDAYQG
jgi:hypothetical protein